MVKRGRLADHFEGVGVKRLSAVDAEPKTSNQHEVGTTVDMRKDFLGEVLQKEFKTTYLWLGGERGIISYESWATHYDARANKPRSSEWRLYYPSNPVTEIMRAGDILFLAKDRSGSLLFIVAPEGSASERQLCWLFGLKPEPEGNSFVSRGFADKDSELDFVARLILDEINIEFEDPEADRLDAIIDEFGTSFPKTLEFSARARETLPEIKAEDDPDAALVAWLDREESLFRRLERRIVAERLERGFMTQEGADVDGFIDFSLKVQNRRKSRMGLSLENHIKAVLDACHVIHDQGARTENDHRPDFLFPGIDAYRRLSAGDSCLTMLGAKSSCKDRWRQVLVEANKIPRKHLLTLEPSISKAQTDQMQASDLQLVVPQAIHESYADAQKTWLWSIRDFISEVLQRQERFHSRGV